MIQFEHTYFLFALLLIPLLALINWLMLRWKEKALDAFGNKYVIAQLFPNVSKTKRTWKAVLFILGYFFLVIAIANPQMGTKMEIVKRTGADLMICLDISNSMMAEDLTPNRLEKAKRSISKLINQLDGDRIGMIVFAGKAYVQLPITTDYSAAKLFLENASTDMIPTQGTAIGDAIDLAIKSFGKDNQSGKAIIVITDGENHEDDAIEVTQTAIDKGINVHTIGMGSPYGAPIPIYNKGEAIDYRKDGEGVTVITKLNETMLKEIALTGKGVYVRASNADDGLRHVLSAISDLEKKEIESNVFSEYQDMFQLLLVPAFILLLIELLMSERKSKLFQRLNLFNEKNQRDED